MGHTRKTQSEQHWPTLDMISTLILCQDYSLRSRDYNEKKARLKVLRRKADERNPDEFYYGMLSSKSNHGRKVAERGNTSLSHDVVKLLKTQDASYLRNAIQETSKAIQKLEQEYSLKEDAIPEVLGRESGEQRSSAHILFAEDLEEQRDFPNRDIQALHEADRLISQSNDTGMNNDDAFDQEEHPTKKSRRKQEKEAQAREEFDLLRKRHRKEQNGRRAKLAALRVREKELRVAENELELQRAKMSNSTGGITRGGKKWQVRERKK